MQNSVPYSCHPGYSDRIPPSFTLPSFPNPSFPFNFPRPSFIPPSFSPHSSPLLRSSCAGVRCSSAGASGLPLDSSGDPASEAERLTAEFMRYVAETGQEWPASNPSPTALLPPNAVVKAQVRSHGWVCTRPRLEGFLVGDAGRTRCACKPMHSHQRGENGSVDS